MSNKLEMNTFEVNMNGTDKSICTFIPQDIVFEHGLIEAVVLGETSKSASGKIDIEDNFIENPAFKETIYSFIETEMINELPLIHAAKEKNEGWVYIIDQRTPTPEGEVPPFDIIGAFEVKNGFLATFSRNKNYKILSMNGFLDLGGSLNNKMNEYLIALLLKNS